MKQILVYGDSLSWGIIPNSRQRFEFTDRWPGVLEMALNSKQQSVRVIENCLNGRRTVWEDPFRPGRNGLQGIQQVIEINVPLILVIIMLGTNDFQSPHPHNSWHAAEGVRALIQAIRQAPIEPGMPCPQILLIAPPVISKPQGPIAEKFQNAEIKCLGLTERLRTLCTELECAFFDSNSVITASRVDGIHLDKEDHHILGEALAGTVIEMIAE